MDFDDAEDLLGNNELPVRQNGALQALYALFNALLGISVITGLIAVVFNCRRWLVNWREHAYKKSVRRKYGIPDDDNEPFNVAYAKAQARRKERSQRTTQQQLPSEAESTVAPQDASSARQERTSPLVSRRRTPVVPAASDTSRIELPGGSSKLFSSPQSAADKVSMNSEAPKSASGIPKAKSEILAHDFATTPSHGKRSLEKNVVDGSSKKSRSGASEQAKSILQGAQMDVAKDETTGHTSTTRARGAKRQAAADDDISNVGSIGKKAGKRARRQSRKLTENINVDGSNEHMDIDPTSSRGKKRDRAEAESSFGDDDSAVGHRGRKSRRQKHKSGTAAELENTTARGTKRSYEVESTLGSDEDDSASRARSPRKRGKRMSSISDVSVAEHMESSAPGKKIGEEWHANGVTYKVGPDGQRVRQVLLRKRASRFSMPEDSQHPDSQARLEIWVETWLNDEEYEAAERRNEIYVPNKKSKKPEVVGVVLEPGKPLLWTPKQIAETPKRNGYGDAIILTNGRGVDPFERPSLTGNAKRIVLDSPVESPIAPPSPAMRPSKSYSKWEKQDLEAEAMARLRKKLEERKKAVMPPPATKKVSFQLPTPGAASSTPAPAAPTNVSAPASLPTPSGPGKMISPAPVTTSTSISTNLFTPSNASAVKSAASAPATAAETSGPGQVKPPAITLTPPQPSKEPSTAAAMPKFTFGSTAVSNRPVTTAVENKDASKPADQAAPQTAGAPSVPNVFGQQAQGAPSVPSGSLPTNIFRKPAQPNASTPAPNVTSSATPSFSFDVKEPAQGDKMTGPVFSMTNRTDKPMSATPSPFGASAKDTMPSNTSNAVASGPNMTGTVQPTSSSSTNATSTATPQFSIGPFGAPANKPVDSTNKPAEQSSVGSTTAAPKFRFGVSSKPAALTSTSQPAPQSTTAEPVSKSAATTPMFSFGSNATTQGTPSGNNAPASGTPTTTAPTMAPTAAPTTAPTTVTTSTPKFSFGAPAPQASTTTQVPAASGDNMATDNNAETSTGTSAMTTATPSTGFGFGFGAPKPTSTSISPSPFGNAAQGSSQSPFGNAAQGSSQSPFVNAAQGSSRSPFANAAQGSSQSPFANATQGSSQSPFANAAQGSSQSPFVNATQGSSQSPFANATSGPSSSPFGTTTQPTGTSSSPFGTTTTSAFGNTSHTVASSSPFGQQAKPAGDAPKPMFMFGANNATNTASNNAATGGKQENKSTFSFNFAAKPAPTFGNTTAPGATNAPSPFGNATNGTTPAFGFGAKPVNSPFGAPAANGNVFGSNAGSGVFGQKS